MGTVLECVVSSRVNTSSPIVREYKRWPLRLRDTPVEGTRSELSLKKLEDSINRESAAFTYTNVLQTFENCLSKESARAVIALHQQSSS
jgi:hypothetical protein